MATAASSRQPFTSEAFDQQIEGVVRAPTTGVRADARQAGLLQALGGRARRPRHSDPAGNLRPHGVTDLALVAVGGGVDVAVPGVQRGGDGVGTFVGGGLEDPETKSGLTTPLLNVMVSMS